MREMDNQNSEKYLIPSLISAGRVLRYLSSYKTHKATLTEISKALSINKSTCYRILLTLMQNNMIAYDYDTKTFSLGPYLIILGQRASELIDYMPIAKDYLKEAVHLTGFTCTLVQRTEDEWIYLAKEEAASPVRVTINVGQRFNLTSGSSGKLFLAYMDKNERDRILGKIGLKKYTSKTIIDRDEFTGEINKVKNLGYAVSLEEHVPGIDGISVPIFDRHGQVTMAIMCIMIHAERKDEEIAGIGEALARLSKELSSKIYHIK